jgi:Na+-transporting methylmalonyl-CoA/oxaloacetate decarboxylase gamma subunit
MQGLYFLAEKEKFVDVFGDDWLARFIQKGIPTAILGIATVFVVLASVWGCLEVFKYVFYTIPEKNKKAKASAPVVEEAAEEVVYQETDDGEIVAAIIAAITAFRAEESGESGNKSGFRVVSFRKK